ncbi:MAG: alcohol dehydrogenase catalytic domain-containing protein [Proteobacteria bacterium]|nr:alcohol dehydrogenase catalytic domain-containing protein [Pseudomonadota bacterium]
MKALVYTAPGEVTYRDEADPVVGAGDALLRIEAVGICGSDMHAFHGHDPRRHPPLILGHELVGTVIDGAGIGRRVTANPLIVCGLCDPCVQGRNNLCRRRAMVGMTRPGAYAERMAIPAQCLIDLPAGMPARVAALTEPAATAVHAIALAERARWRPLNEARALILGGGAIGLLAALFLRHRGVDVTLAETNPLRRASAECHAGCATYDPRERGPEPDAYGFVIDAVGAKPTRQAALAAVQPGGVVLHIGLQDWASEIDMRKLTLDEITLIGTYTYTTADLRATVAALGRGAFGDLSWVEERALADGARAFADLDQGRTAAAKLVLVPG